MVLHTQTHTHTHKRVQGMDYAFSLSSALIPFLRSLVTQEVHIQTVKVGMTTPMTMRVPHDMRAGPLLTELERVEEMVMVCTNM